MKKLLLLPLLAISLVGCGAISTNSSVPTKVEPIYPETSKTEEEWIELDNKTFLYIYIGNTYKNYGKVGNEYVRYCVKRYGDIYQIKVKYKRESDSFGYVETFISDSLSYYLTETIF